MNDIKETWFKWDYVCTNCDSHVEMTIKCFGFHHSEVCPKCFERLTLMSVVDVTIPTKQTKEDTMDTLIDPTLIPITNPAQQVSVFVDGGRVNKVFLVDNIISSRFEDSDDQETLKLIAEALGISLYKEISYTATVTVSGTLQVDITEDYDLESLVYDTIAGGLYDVDFSIDDVEER